MSPAIEPVSNKTTQASRPFYTFGSFIFVIKYVLVASASYTVVNSYIKSCLTLPVKSIFLTLYSHIEHS